MCEQYVLKHSSVPYWFQVHIGDGCLNPKKQTRKCELSLKGLAFKTHTNTNIHTHFLLFSHKAIMVTHMQTLPGERCLLAQSNKSMVALMNSCGLQMKHRMMLFDETRSCAGIVSIWEPAAPLPGRGITAQHVAAHSA